MVRGKFNYFSQNTWAGPLSGVLVWDTRRLCYGIELENKSILTINHGYDAYGSSLEFVGIQY